MIGAHRVQAATPVPTQKPVILVLGDSLSAEYGLPRGRGWVQHLVARLEHEKMPHAVVNASISGETTAGGLARLPALLTRHRPAVVIVELGGNDALRGLDLQTTTAHLRSMIQQSQQAQAHVLLLGMRVPPNYGKAYSQGLEAVYRDLARREQVAWVPFFLAEFAHQPEYFQPDQIHPNERAQPRMLAAIWPALRPLLRTKVGHELDTGGLHTSHRSRQ